MKKTYVVQRMTETNYHIYMTGGYNYTVEKFKVMAENTEEAIGLAQKEGYVVNKDFVRTQEEIEAEKRANEEELAEMRRKEEEAKIKKAEAVVRKATALGLTVEEYKEKKNKERRIHKLENDITYYEAKLAEAKAKLAKELTN